MELSFILLIIIIGYVIIDKCYEGFVSYPDSIVDCKPEPDYKNINENVLKSPRLESYRSYSKNKDMYSLNSRILKDKKCDPQGIPTSFY